MSSILVAVKAVIPAMKAVLSPLSIRVEREKINRVRQEKGFVGPNYTVYRCGKMAGYTNNAIATSVEVKLLFPKIGFNWSDYLDISLKVNHLGL